MSSNNLRKDQMCMFRMQFIIKCQTINSVQDENSNYILYNEVTQLRMI